MGWFADLFKFDLPRHESQGPTQQELAEAEAEGYKWDDRCGFYKESYEEPGRVLIAVATSAPPSLDAAAEDSPG